MTATVTSKGQITIPLAIRQRLNLKPGDELEFDEHAPVLTAHRVVNQREWEATLRDWQKSAAKALKGHPWERKSSAELLDDLRGGGAWKIKPAAHDPALDSSVLWAIIRQEPGRETWLQALLKAATEGPLVICPVAFAELAPSAPEETALSGFLSRLSIAYEPISPAAAFLAGQTFKCYRQAGGPRQHLVPDFVIAAHAQCQANRLAALDRGYLRKWFPELRLLVP